MQNNIYSTRTTSRKTSRKKYTTQDKNIRTQDEPKSTFELPTIFYFFLGGAAFPYGRWVKGSFPAATHILHMGRTVGIDKVTNTELFYYSSLEARRKIFGLLSIQEKEKYFRNSLLLPFRINFLPVRDRSISLALRSRRLGMRLE